jgi:hypothetical protein
VPVEDDEGEVIPKAIPVPDDEEIPRAIPVEE